MRALLRPLLLKVLRRSPAEIVQRARAFRIDSQDGRDLVAGVAESFIGGFNAMLESAGLGGVAARGARVPDHFRPFFFEGAAMGYLPRRLVWPGASPASAESDLMAMAPGYRYLYYVGLGFWKAFVSGSPGAAARLERHLDPMYAPLCLDGFGFKVAFYGAAAEPERLVRLAARLGGDRATPFWQGIGRGLYFVYLEDPAGFEKCAACLPAARWDDLEFGRALALGFTRTDRPGLLLDHIDAARGEGIRTARLGGLTWALAARRMTDPGYLERCLERAPGPGRWLLAELPLLCERALAEAGSYLDWQRRTMEAAGRLTLPAASPRGGGATPSR